MNEHKSHQGEIHVHAPGGGHATIGHRGHDDYVMDGRLEHVQGKSVEPRSLDVDKVNPAACTPTHACGGHAADHTHGLTCEHVAVPHGGHLDYIVDGHLHHPCDKHCDDHGPVQVRPALQTPGRDMGGTGVSSRRPMKHWRTK